MIFLLLLKKNQKKKFFFLEDLHFVENIRNCFGWDFVWPKLSAAAGFAMNEKFHLFERNFCFLARNHRRLYYVKILDYKFNCFRMISSFLRGGQYGPVKLFLISSGNRFEQRTSPPLGIRTTWQFCKIEQSFQRKEEKRKPKLLWDLNPGPVDLKSFPLELPSLLKWRK